MKDEVCNFTLARACRALALRRRTDHFDRMRESLRLAEETHVFEEVLSTLTHMAVVGGGGCRRKLVNVLRPHLAQTDVRLSDIIWSVWSADLRELKPDIERIATSGPDDIEGGKGCSHRSEATPVKGRYHMARKVAALWNEEDPGTRGRLLLALGFQDAFYIVESDEVERGLRMRSELHGLARTMSADQLRQLAAFISWYESEHMKREPEPVYLERREKFAALARAALGVAGETPE